MAKSTWIQSNFNGGEWSPLAQGRYDLAKYKNGLAECLNFVPLQQGGLTRRAGTRYAAMVKDQAHAPRLQKFEFSIDQSYVLEFGNGYIRIFVNEGQLLAPTTGNNYNNALPYTLGDIVTYSAAQYYCIAATTGNLPTDVTYWHPLPGAILDIPTTYSDTDVWGLNFAQSADTLFITHPDHPPRKLQRASATKWLISDVAFQDGPYNNINISPTTLTPSASTGTVFVVASSIVGINGGVGFRPDDVGRLLRIKCGGVWLWGIIVGYTAPTQVVWEIQPPTGTGLPSTATADANISAGSVFSVSVTDGGSGYGVAPPSVSFSGGGGAGAIAYATLNNGVVVAVTVAVTGSGYTSAPGVAFTAPAGVVASTTTFWRLGLWNAADGYPRCVTFHQDRLCLAGAANTPNQVNASATADYEGFSPTNQDGTVVDSNAFSFSLNSGTVNSILWLASDEWGLMAGTAGGEWIISPSSAQQAITPTNVNAKQISNYGSSTAAPVRVGKATMFIQRTGRKLRELFYQFTYNTFQVPDISLVGEHLTKGGIKEMTVQLAPQQVIWAARKDGALIGVTYDKDQEVVAWHGHSLGGYSNAGKTAAPLVESVACIPSPDISRDTLWLAVNRYVNGAISRTIEFSAKSWEDGDAVEDGVFLDSSGVQTGSAFSSITGLTWLKGETVSILADGATHPDVVVDSSGVAALTRTADKAQVGLKYTSRAKTLCIESGGTDGPTQGKLKRLFQSVFRLFQTNTLSLGSAAPGISTYPEPFRNNGDPMDAPVPLFTGDKRWTVEGTFSTDGQLYFETSDPLPCNITMLMVQLESSDRT